MFLEQFDRSGTVKEGRKDESGQLGKDIEARVCARKKRGQATPVRVRKVTECCDHSGALPGAVLPQDATREII
jgi:hypothetical protein